MREQLENAVCISVRAISKWEKGESLPNLGTFAALCKTLGVSADKLLGIESGNDAKSLTMALAKQLGGFDNDKERHAALMDVLRVLVSTGGGPCNPDRNVAYQPTKD